MSFGLFGDHELDNTSNHLHGARYTALDEHEKHTLGNEKALNCIAHVAEGSAVSIKVSRRFSTALSFGRKAEDSSNNKAGENSTTSKAMAASAEYAARPEDASSTEEYKECKDAMEQVKVRIEG